MNLKEYPDKLHNFGDKLHKKGPIFLMEPLENYRNSN